MPRLQGFLNKMTVPKLRFTDPSGMDFPDWQVRQLGQISSIKRGASPRPISDKKWFSNKSNIGWVRISDVTSSNKYLNSTQQYLSEEGVSKSRLIAKGNIIMSICATIGKPIYTNFDACIHDGFVVFEDLQIDHEYLYYYLSRIEKNWYRYGQPGSQVNLNSDIVANESIAVPHLSEQKKIAEFLSSVDEKISLLTQQHKKLETYKKGVMQRIFARELQFKTETGASYPEWKQVKLEDIADTTTGSSNRADSSLIGEYTFFDRSEDIRTSDRYLFDCEAIIVPGEGQAFMPKYFIGKFDLHQRAYAIMNFKNSLSKFVYFHIEFYKNYFLSKAVGSTVKSLRLPMFNEMPIQLPSIEEQEKIIAFLTSIDDKILNACKQLELTKQYKEGLLQQMFV